MGSWRAAGCHADHEGPILFRAYDAGDLRRGLCLGQLTWSRLTRQIFPVVMAVPMGCVASVRNDPR
ncbi:hypothetical protein Gbfr_007_057 [Gluconobacter frateurii M-2]|nr:hypothetical protein Gbfr_007_057 [Gluconobacter frateurii M-2]